VLKDGESVWNNGKSNVKAADNKQSHRKIIIAEGHMSQAKRNY
jgi:hypothetical protein